MINQPPSKSEVVQAGRLLGGNLIWTPESHEGHVKVFQVAYDWRNSHLYPMRRMRQELTGKVRAFKLEGVTAARTKRMTSIRKKLARSSITLAQIQDLGGCRAIVDTIASVDALVRFYRGGGSAHEVRKDQSYIEAPKAGGYRSHHFVMDFVGEPEDAIYKGRRIEVQIRTRSQHAWATAVEAVGMVRGEDLKAGEGSADWLRLFALMSSEFAEAEGCPLVPGTSDRHARREEILDLDVRLKAAQTLQNINDALKTTELIGPRRSDSFLVQYDGDRQTLVIHGFKSPGRGFARYVADEEKLRTLDSVLVEVDKAENLRDAYPNYFLDVAAFASSILKITGRDTVRPTGIQIQPPRDLSFLHVWRKRKPGSNVQ